MKHLKHSIATLLKNELFLLTALSLLVVQGMYMFHLQHFTVVQPAQAQPATEIPSGTVTAFDLASCPTGWSEYTAARGRFVMGTNPTQFSNSPNGEGNIRALSLNQTAGAEIHTVTIAQMPTHNHTGTTTNPTGTANALLNAAGPMAGGGWGALASTTGVRWALSSIVANGGGASHNNMPPFVALLYCQKD